MLGFINIVVINIVVSVVGRNLQSTVLKNMGEC